jgi:hypothetical protein
MRINILGKQSLASAIIVAGVNWIQFWLKSKTGIELKEDIIWKIYYELDRFSDRLKLQKMIESIDEEEFFEFLDEFIEVVDEETVKNPKILENKQLLWEIFKVLKEFSKKGWVKDNPITNEVKFQINKKINETPELLNYKVKRDVDMAILDYNKEVKKMGLEPPDNKPIYSEKPSDGSSAQDLLGGEMRLRAPWVQDEG